MPIADRCANPCSLSPPPAALAGVAWSNGRQLTGFSKGPISADYEYDINGQRTKKIFHRVADSITTEYYYNNGMFLGFYRSIKNCANA